MANLVTYDEVRKLIGIGTDIIADADITSIITEVQKKTLSHFKVFITPTKVLEMLDGNNKNQVLVNHPFLWKVLALQTGDTTFALSNVNINPKSGIITLDNTTNPYYFSLGRNNVKVKYLSAFMEKTSTITESDADVVAGSSVAISVDSETGFTTGDWIFIEGLDGNIEAAQITGTGVGELTVDLLVQAHEADSVITLLQTHELLRQFVLYESALSAATNSVGGSYSFATSYSFPEYSTTLGVPHPHFSKVVNDIGKQRDIIKRSIYNKLNAVS